MRPARAVGSACPRRATSTSEPTLCVTSDPRARPASELSGDGRRVLEVLVRRAVVATGKRRALARPAPPARRRAAGGGAREGGRRPLPRLAVRGRRRPAGDAAVEDARLRVLLDERRRGADAFARRPGHLC